MITRDIEKNITKYLENDRIVLLLGARQVGKTTIIKNLKKELDKEKQENFYINLENPQFLELLNKHPENLFQITGKTTTRKIVFIDEIQYLKDPSNFLKYIYDEYAGTIKLVVSGSSAFYIDKNFKDSLAGRKKIFYIHTLSFSEFLRFKNQNSLVPYLEQIEAIPILPYQELLNYYYEYMTFGGYPAVVLADTISEKKELLEEIGLSYIKKDILEANIHYEEKYYYLLKILANQVGNLLNTNELANTVNLPVPTVENYLYIMKKSFHIATITPFYQNIRKELTKMPKVYFCDTGLRNYFINNFEGFDMRVDKGQLFENAVFKKLLEKYTIYDIQYRRTQNKNEVDFIIAKDKKAVEVKIHAEKFNPSKYQLFVKNYPDFDLKVCAIKNVFGKI